MIEDVYSTLSIGEDVDESQHRLAHPYPFFESRRSFCEALVKCNLKNDDPYTWVDRTGMEVLRFERIASPFREIMQEAYIRQHSKNCK